MYKTAISKVFLSIGISLLCDAAAFAMQPIVEHPPYNRHKRAKRSAPRKRVKGASLNKGTNNGRGSMQVKKSAYSAAHVRISNKANAAPLSQKTNVTPVSHNANATPSSQKANATLAQHNAMMVSPSINAGNAQQNPPSAEYLDSNVASRLLNVRRERMTLERQKQDWLIELARHRAIFSQTIPSADNKQQQSILLALSSKSVDDFVHGSVMLNYLSEHTRQENKEYLSLIQKISCVDAMIQNCARVEAAIGGVGTAIPPVPTTNSTSTPVPPFVPTANPVPPFVPTANPVTPFVPTANPIPTS